jgi:SAM-dependent methyltransferase
MGITKATASLLFELKRAVDLRGAVCQLGRQSIDLSARQVLAIADQFTAHLAVSVSEQTVTDGDAEIGDDLLFRMLGFDVVESLDVSGYESATHIHDLNLPIPEQLKEKYDLVFDGGTLEHVFDIPQCLRNIHALLKPGGLIVHCSPANNWVDHGFYMFSPTLFSDYYSANNYSVLRSNVIESSAANPMVRSIVYEYSPGVIDHRSVGGWGGGKTLRTWFVAQKISGATATFIPQQGTYRRTWPEMRDTESLPASDKQTVIRVIGKYIRGQADANRVPYKALFWALTPLVVAYRFLQRRQGVKIVARY